MISKEQIEVDCFGCNARDWNDPLPFACVVQGTKEHTYCKSLAQRARSRLVQSDQAHRPPPKFKFAELFAGIGGFRVALEQAGGECVFASEIDHEARLVWPKLVLMHQYLCDWPWYKGHCTMRINSETSHLAEHITHLCARSEIAN